MGPRSCSRRGGAGVECGVRAGQSGHPWPDPSRTRTSPGGGGPTGPHAFIRECPHSWIRPLPTVSRPPLEAPSGAARHAARRVVRDARRRRDVPRDVHRQRRLQRHLDPGTIILGVSRRRPSPPRTSCPATPATRPSPVNNTGTGELRYALDQLGHNTDGKGLRSQLTLTIQAGHLRRPGRHALLGSAQRRRAGRHRPGRPDRRPQRRGRRARTTCASLGVRHRRRQRRTRPPRPRRRSPSPPSRPPTTRSPIARRVPGPRFAGRARGSHFPDADRAHRDRSPHTWSPAMPLVTFVTRIARKTLDVLLLLLIVVRARHVVLARIMPRSPAARPSWSAGRRWSRRSRSVGGPRRPGHPGPARARRRRQPPGRDQNAVFTHRITRVVQPPTGSTSRPRATRTRTADPSLVPAEGRHRPGRRRRAVRGLRGRPPQLLPGRDVPDRLRDGPAGRRLAARDASRTSSESDAPARPPGPRHVRARVAGRAPGRRLTVRAPDSP